MGGHGGLNILPQKKWNVYNHDNRAIVDRDKKIAEDKKREKYQKDRERALEDKMDVIRAENGGDIREKTDGLKSEPILSSLNEQFKKLNEKTHINLFEKQQKIIENQQIMEIKRLQEAEFLKDKNMDFSSRFLGTYADGKKSAPWYARQKGYQQQKKKPVDISQLLSVKKSESNTIGEVIQIQKKIQKQAPSHKQKHNSQEQERSRQKIHKNKESESGKTEMEILREKRLKREKKERERALLLKKVYQ